MRSAKLLNVPCDFDAAGEIAGRSRGTPRIANALLRRVRDFAQVKGNGRINMEIAHIALEALNIATGETINFSSREDDHAILIYKLEPTTGMLRTRAYIGQHMPLYCSAMGKIYMAFGHPDYVKSYWENHQHEIQPLTRNTITELPAMFDELAHIRESGAAMDREENELGVSCIAVPVFDIHGRVPYAVSISLSTSRLKQVGEKNLLKPLRETAQAISNELGFTVRDDLGAIT